jgi:pyridoxine 5-phosphate synthase
VSTSLSVNLNKVALLRNSRGASNPGPLPAARTCLDHGAYGITLHWRSDNRHTRIDDVRAIRQLCLERGAEFNLEGDARDDLVALAIELRVTQFTLVPVKPGEVTSDHGWDLPRQHDVIAPIIAKVKAAGIRTAIFMDPQADLMPAAAATGCDRVEIYTEPYASAWRTTKQPEAFLQLQNAARRATALGLGVNAGHDLNLLNMPLLANEIPEIVEVSIGHALIADSLYLGLAETIARYVRVCRGEVVDAPVTQ